MIKTIDDYIGSDSGRKLPNTPNKINSCGDIFESDNSSNLMPQKSFISFKRSKLKILNGYLKKKSPYMLQGWQVNN